MFFPFRRFRRQDVRNGDPNTLCSGGKVTTLIILNAEGLIIHRASKQNTLNDGLRF